MRQKLRSCRYYHRPINTKKLVEVGFSGVPRSTTLARLIVKNRVPDVTASPGLREIEDRDAQQVGDLLRAYLARFDLSPVMSDEEILHNFYSGKGSGPVDPVTGWRKGQVTWTYVVEVCQSVKVRLSLLTPSIGSGLASHNRLLLLLHLAIDSVAEQSATNDQCCVPVLHSFSRLSEL